MKTKMILAAAVFSTMFNHLKAQAWSCTSLVGGCYRDGPIGINTSGSPSTFLEVRCGSAWGGGSSGIIYEDNRNTNSAGRSAYLQIGMTYLKKQWRLNLDGNSSGNFTIDDQYWGTGAYTATRFMIDGSNGNVGIGTTSPVSKLTVESGSSPGLTINNSGGSYALGVQDPTSANTNKFNFKVDHTGKTYIGYKTQIGLHSDALLTVYGKAAATEVVVTQTNWSDFVFDDKYNLMPLKDLESFYKKNHHLPNVLSTREVVESGNNLAQTDAVLLQKIEELTLYIVELEKRLNTLEQK